MLCVYKMNCLPVPTTILSYMVQNTVNAKCIPDIRYQKWKDNVKRNSLLFTGVIIHVLIMKKQQYSFLVQLPSHVQLFATLWTAARLASLSITKSQSLHKLMSIELGMPSNHFILCHPLLLPSSIFPSIRVFSNESVLPIRWPKYWSLSFSISSSSEYSGLISFRVDGVDLLAVWGILKSLLQHHSSKASILWHSAFYGPSLTSIHDHWKNHSFD